MRITSIEPLSREDLLLKIRHTRLLGFNGAKPYEFAKLTLESLPSAALAPAQRYVLSDGVQTILELRAALAERGVDLFALDGGVLIRTSESDEVIPVIPPMVELSLEPDGRTVLVITDGMHRVFAARSVGSDIVCVVARDVPAAYPYYAYALPDGWGDVVELDSLPDGFQKKTYRLPETYRALFRDFNEHLPGVQQRRPPTNPSHLKP